MKRCIALVLILTLMVSLTAAVSATEATENVSGNSQEVLASYEEGTQDRTIVSVDISWEQMSFTYKGESAPAWNAEEHRYEGEATEAGWAPGAGLITIRNNSNAVLQALISYKQETAYNDVYMSFTDEAPYIGSAHTDDRKDEQGEVCGTPCEITVKAIPMGTLPKETVDNTRIGAITITLNSDVDVYEMIDAVGNKLFAYHVGDASELPRGTRYLVSGTDVTAIQCLVDDALLNYDEDAGLTPEDNVAINKALTAFYGALDIKQ